MVRFPARMAPLVILAAAFSPVGPLPLQPDWSLGSAQPASFLAWSVASAGDVNGDGCSDVIIGDPRFDGAATDEGRALVYLGSPAGLSPMPAWTFFGGVAGALLGASVACAGDVDNDGFDDIIVGAPDLKIGLSFEGVAYIFKGGASGPSAAYSWR